jgi:hypothetical protein
VTIFARRFLLHPVEHDRLLWPAAKTATTTSRSAIAASRSSSTSSSAATRAAASARSRASAFTRTASPGEHTPGQSDRVIVCHFEVPGNSPRLRDQRNGLPSDRAGIDIQHRRISNLRHGPAYLSGRIHLQIQHDRLRPASAAAAPPSIFGSSGRIFLSLKRRRNIVRLPLPRQLGLSINAGGRSQQTRRDQ